MNKILFVNACVRPESRTAVLAHHILDKLDGSIEEVRLAEEDIKPLDLQLLKKRDEYGRAGDFSDDMFRYAKQFAESDIVVVAAPYWDMSFPAMLKIYFEAVSVQGVTFRYSEDGMPVGLTNVKKVIYVTTAGGPVGDFNLGFDYVRSLCGMLYGIPEVVCNKAEFLDIIGADVDAILRRTMDEIDREYEEENK